MNRTPLIAATLAVSALLSGCVGTGPNTEQGAVTGGALGALAGAIIGHNSRGGDALGGAILGGTLGAITGGSIGNSVDQQNGTIYGYPDERGRRRVSQVRVQEVGPPPPPYSEKVPAPPAPNSIWVPGYWSLDRYGYSWISGTWEIPPPHARTYIAAHWERQGDRDVYVPASWR